MQDVLGGEIDALGDAHVAVVRHPRRLADRDIGLRHHADGVHHERIAFPAPDGVAVKSGVRVSGVRAPIGIDAAQAVAV